jgi:hypothetical protein
MSNVIREPSGDGRPGIVTGPTRTTLPASRNPAPRNVTRKGYAAPAGPSDGSIVASTGGFASANVTFDVGMLVNPTLATTAIIGLNTVRD